MIMLMDTTGTVPLATRCVSEFIASLMFIYLGLALLANEILPKTKGRRMGFAMVCIGFGFAFFIAMQLFGRVSAIVNPALCVSFYILGQLDMSEMLALIAAEMLGMMAAAVLVLVHYWCHFAVVPEPPCMNLDKAPLLYSPPAPVAESSQRIDCSSILDPGFPSEQDTQAEIRYREEVAADQAGKLSVFATRPEIYHPLANFTSEFLSTTVLLLCVLLMIDNASSLPPVYTPLYNRGMAGYLASIVGIVVYMALGGPTGFSGNPTRDLGPRLVHFLAPIPGKGSSEWGYAWIPSVAPMFGGAAAAYLYLVIKPIFQFGTTAM